MTLRDWLEKIDGKLHDIDSTLIRHDENLREHMRRTELLENSQEKLRDEIAPLKRFREGTMLLVKIVAVAAPLATGVLVKLFLK